MKLPGAPWRLERANDYLTIVDVDNLVVAAYDLEELAETVDRSGPELVARAITALPRLFEEVARIIVADEKNDPEAAGAAVDRLVGIYRELEIPIQTDGV